MNHNELQDYLRQKLAQRVKESENNAMPAHGGMRIYDAPLVGFAAAEDPIFTEFQKQEVVGPNFFLPTGWLPGAKTVVSYFLPFSEEIRKSNRGLGLPSQEWMSARIDGEVVNNEIRTYLSGLLKELGGEAVAPCLDSRFEIKKRISNWSERHVAHAAGLGTFGLHRALITESGTAGRLGSVVTTLKIAPTERQYDRYDAYCLFFNGGKCGACIRRCPTGAISTAGKDHGICSDYIDNEILARWRPRYGCAKCNAAVPCEHRNPTASRAAG